MTRTIDVLATGSARLVRIMAIEGIDHLIAECTELDAQAAWAATDWNGKPVYAGTFAVDNRQTANPWEPFQPGGTATVTVLDDEFGILTHRTAGGAETELKASIDRTSLFLSVKDAFQFPGDLDLHVGTECMEATVSSNDEFTVFVRGKYSPFATGTGQRFTHDHRVGHVDYGPFLMPKVTEYPREWEGRWVGIWLHTYDENGINSKADALCIFAGRLKEITDDAETGATVVLAEHALSSFKETTIGRDLFSATAKDGIYLKAGMTFRFNDENSVSAKTANPLTVVVSGASGTNQVNQGFYSHAELFNALDAWWAAETIASRIWGTYTIATASIPPNGEIRAKIYWFTPGSGLRVEWHFEIPATVAYFLGFTGTAPSTSSHSKTVTGSGSPNTKHHFYYQDGPAPLRSYAGTGADDVKLVLENIAGTFQDQYEWLPTYMKPAHNTLNGTGVFVFDEKGIIVASITDNGNGTCDLTNITPQNLEVIEAFWKRIDDPTPIRVRQIFLLEMSWADYWKRFLYSTGTAGFNHASYDQFPFGCGVGIPGEILGAAFEISVDNVDGANYVVSAMIDKPVTMITNNSPDLILRHTFPVWKLGGLRMATWQTPSASLAVASLTEDNKADPAGNRISPFSPTTLFGDWAHPIIKIRYNRFLANNGDEYRDTINIEDRTAVDSRGDLGEPFTIEVKNTYAELNAPAAGVEALVPNTFLPPITMFTRPVRRLRRSIGPMQYELAPGDIVTVTDTFARDPSTGIRHVTSRPAIIVATGTNLGGPVPSGDKSAPMVGEVELAFADTNRIYAYAPSASISSYNGGTKTITLNSHEYSQAAELTDPEYFGAGFAIRITEIDPADATTALTWTRNIVSRTGNALVHDGVALASFNAAKKYRVTFGTYSAVISLQHDKAFCADETNGLIEHTAQANMYGSSTSQIATPLSVHTDLGELHADPVIDSSDGRAYDVGSLKGFTRLVDNLIDHKTAICSPVLGAVANNTTYPTGYKLVRVEPIFLTNATLNNQVVRYLYVAPWIRSSDGTKASVRVTLLPNAPSADTVNDGLIDSPNSQIEFTTTSTTWSQPARSFLTINVKTSRVAWLLVECSYKAETRGLSYCREGERFVVV